MGLPADLSHTQDHQKNELVTVLRAKYVSDIECQVLTAHFFSKVLRFMNLLIVCCCRF